MSTFGSRLRKLDDRFGLASETIAQLHLRALREIARRDMAEEEAPSDLKTSEDGPPEEAWRQILLIPKR